MGGGRGEGSNSGKGWGCVGNGKTASGTRGTSEKWFGGGISGESVRQEPRIRVKRGGTASQQAITPVLRHSHVIYPHYSPLQSSQRTLGLSYCHRRQGSLSFVDCQQLLQSLNTYPTITSANSRVNVLDGSRAVRLPAPVPMRFATRNAKDRSLPGVSHTNSQLQHIRSTPLIPPRNALHERTSPHTGKPAPCEVVRLTSLPSRKQKYPFRH